MTKKQSNNLRLVSHAVVLLTDGKAEAPAEIVLFPPGTIHTTKLPPFLVDAIGARRCIEQFSSLGRDVVTDYDHGTFNEVLAAEGKAPASGWIKSMRWDPTQGLLARIDWTARAKGLIESREYRYFSPTIFVDEAGRLAEIAAGALTNDPATHHALPLMASRLLASREAGDAVGANQGDRMQAIAQIVGVSPDAGLDAILAAINEGNLPRVAVALGLPETASKETVMEELKKKAGGGAGRGGDGGGGAPATNAGGDSPGHLSQQAITDLATELGLGTAVTSREQLVTLARDRMKPSGPTAEQYAELVKEVASLKTQRSEDEFEAICLSGAGKERISPAMKPGMKALFLSNRKLFDDTVAGMNPLVNSKSELDAGGGKKSDEPVDRSKLISLARQNFASEKAKKTVLCSEQAWVNLELRDKRQSALTADEVRTSGIAAD